MRSRATPSATHGWCGTGSRLMLDFVMRVVVPGRNHGQRLALMRLLDAMRGDTPVIAAELRPPRAELDAAEGMDAWIDTYHAVRSLTRQGIRVFLTDSAVGTQEENNLRHLVTNLGNDVARSHVVPFLTSKHSLEFCAVVRGAGSAARLRFAGGARRRQDRRPAALRRTRLGTARRNPSSASRACRSAAGPTRRRTRSRQVDFLVDPNFTGEYYLTQIVSHLESRAGAAFLDESRRREVDHPRDVRRVLLSQRQPADSPGAEPLPAGAGRRPGRRVRDRRRAPTAHSCRARIHSRRAMRRAAACAISTSATCR